MGVKIHPTAIVHPGAKLSEEVDVGPYAQIGEHVSIGARTKIGASCIVEGRTVCGEDNQFFAGAVIGSIPQDLKYQGETNQLTIGSRNRIREYVTINPGTQGGGSKTAIGDDNLLMAYAHIAHDCVIGNRVIIANAGTLAGHILVEDRAVIGGLVGVHQFVRIGTLAIIGGVSRITKDVPPYAMCVGNPTAHVYGLNVEGLRRAGMTQETKRALKQAFKILFNSGLAFSHAIAQVERDVTKCPEVAHLLEFIRHSKRGVAAGARPVSPRTPARFSVE